MFHHDDAAGQKTRSVLARFAKWPAQSSDLNITEHIRDELECQLCIGSLQLTSVPNFTNTLMTI